MYKFILSIAFFGLLIACQTEQKPSLVSAPTLAEKPTTVITQTKKEVPKKEVTTMIQEPKQSIEIVGQDGKTQAIELTQPKVKMANTPKPTKKETTASPKPTPPKKEELAKPQPVAVTQPKITNANQVMATKVVTPTPPPSPKAEPTKVVTVPIPTKEVVKDTPPPPPAFSHTPWDALLRKHVSSNGKVNYAGFQSDKSAFDAYLKFLAEHPIQDSWSRNKKMAYWINAYNAFTVKLIIDNYPVASITDLHGGKPWDQKWIQLGGKTYSLNNIENDILRPQYKDARIHFAVNCAAKSCPPLLNRAWTASNLESNFEQQAKAFINNASYNKIGSDEVQISKIFEWYAGDFGDIVTYLNKYANTKIKSGAKVSYLEYDWALNK